MNFLLDCGIDSETLAKIRLNNSHQLVLDAEWNIERVIGSINYLKKIGINVLDKILINRFDIVLRGEENLRESFNKTSQERLVRMINKDIKYLYYLDLY